MPHDHGAEIKSVTKGVESPVTVRERLRAAIKLIVASVIALGLSSTLLALVMASPDIDRAALAGVAASCGATAALLGAGAWYLRERRRELQRAERNSLTDPLTGLPNRKLFRDRAEQTIARARRNGESVALMLLDLDGFKEVNDTLGHHHGDLLLQEIGRRLGASLRGVDTVARLGGDEFGVLIADVKHPSSAIHVADKVREAVRVPLAIDAFSLSVDVSTGIALFPGHGRDFNTLMQRADVAMYMAKAGRSGAELYTAERDPYSPNRLALVHDLKSALESDEMLIHYQPKLELASGQVTGVEALVRWRHPTRGLILPDEFISIAENTGHIGPLTSWVLDKAIRQKSEWQRSGLDLAMAVNLSPRNLADHTLPRQVARVLERWGVDADELEFEITESAIMSNPERSIETLKRLRRLGVRLSIDDFGTGHSSLAYLQRLPVTGIKIDRSFVSGMRTTRSGYTIVRSAIDIARSLGLVVVAEGVEHSEEWDALAVLGCHLAQGYFKARPVPPEQIEMVTRLIDSPPGF